MNDFWCIILFFYTTSYSNSSNLTNGLVHLLWQSGVLITQACLKHRAAIEFEAI